VVGPANTGEPETAGPENVMLYVDAASCPPLKIALTLVAEVLVNPTETILVFWIFPDIPNTNAAITAARITVIATIRITPITGDTASSFFLVTTIVLNTLSNAHEGKTMYTISMKIISI
jgi:hypothetical protein